MILIKLVSKFNYVMCKHMYKLILKNMDLIL